MLKSFVKRAFRRLGFDLRRYRPESSEPAQFMAMLSSHGVNLVFDVGANAGQFGRSLREAGYGGRIVSFEPLASARGQLLATSRNDPLWEVAPRAALGSENGAIDINVAGNSESSSVLNMLASHADVVPESRYVEIERVPMVRFDAIALDYLREDSVAFQKIDTQGYEDRVLEGSRGLLDRLIGLQVELSLVPLYEGQSLFSELLEQITAQDFELWAISPVFIDPQSGRLLQIDATFFRRRANES